MQQESDESCMSGLFQLSLGQIRIHTLWYETNISLSQLCTISHYFKARNSSNNKLYTTLNYVCNWFRGRLLIEVSVPCPKQHKLVLPIDLSWDSQGYTTKTPSAVDLQYGPLRVFYDSVMASKQIQLLNTEQHYIISSSTCIRVLPPCDVCVCDSPGWRS